MLMKLIFILAIILIANVSLGQTTEVLKLKGKKYYSEQNTISVDSNVVLILETCHDDPEITDDGFCLHLKMSFLDSSKARQLKTLNIDKDTSIIKCQFYVSSIWNYDDKASISGTVSIISWTKKSIEVYLELNIENKGLIKTQMYSYDGKKVFRAKKG
jgi:hypothetical protein